VLALAVVAALAASPGLHVHHDSRSGQHVSEGQRHGAANHLHADEHSHDAEHERIVRPSVDDDPILLDGSWLKPERPTLVVATALGGPAAVLPLPSRSSQEWAFTQPRAHDPPDDSPRIPRGPPAFNLA